MDWTLLVALLGTGTVASVAAILITRALGPTQIEQQKANDSANEAFDKRALNQVALLEASVKAFQDRFDATEKKLGQVEKVNGELMSVNTELRNEKEALRAEIIEINRRTEAESERADAAEKAKKAAIRRAVAAEARADEAEEALASLRASLPGANGG